MLKANYKYYLSNGIAIEYTFPPKDSWISLVDSIVLDYSTQTSNRFNIPFYIRVKPMVAHMLNKECMSRPYFYTGTSTLPGFSVLRINTIAGSVEVVSDPNLEFPIFFGSDEEYEDNTFNNHMEKILNE